MDTSERDEGLDGASVEALLARTKGRSTELRRRRTILGAGASALTVGLVVALAVVVLPGSSKPSAPPPIAQKGLVVTAQVDGAAEYAAPVAHAEPQVGSRQEQAVSAAEQAFSLRFLQALQRSNGTSASETTNQVVSPSSLAEALSMLELGAKGVTESQIASLLGSSGLSPAAQAAGWNALDADLASGSTGSAGSLILQQANALWSQEGLPLVPTFMRQLRQAYGAGLWQVNFETAAATAAINAWASQQTHGKINQLFPPGPLGASVSLILADAIYFKGAWQYPFDPNMSPSDFTTGTGSTVRPQFMFTSNEGVTLLPWADTPAYSAVELPYKGGRFSALVVMPKSGGLDGMVANLDLVRLNSIVASLHTSQVAVEMPTFQFSTGLELSSVLQSMGMKAAFGPAADLSGISTKVALQVQSVIQKAFLHVSTAGTEAAAVTAIAIGSSAVVPRKQITINHPFLFLIRDNRTGTILFASSVVNPTAG
jgi:serpin B